MGSGKLAVDQGCCCRLQRLGIHIGGQDRRIAVRARHHAPPSGTNVVHLPRPGASSFVQRHEMSLDDLTGVHLSQALPIQPVALGLATPSAELQTELPETVTTATNSRTSSKKFGWQVFLPLSTVAICAAMGWALTHPDAWAMAKTMLNTTHAWMASIIWGV